MEGELQQAGMDWDAYFAAAGVESKEVYEAELRENVENAIRTQFVLDSIADAREVTVDNDDLSAQIMAQAQRSRMSPEQYAQQLQEQGNISDFVADVRRTKALAQLLEQTTITDASGGVVDLEALRTQGAQTVRAAADPAAPEADAEGAEADAVVTEGESTVDEAVATEADAPDAPADKA
jgi:trigger factor